jgi:L-lysine 2,3-aminomutase
LYHLLRVPVHLLLPSSPCEGACLFCFHSWFILQLDVALYLSYHFYRRGVPI